MTKRIIINKGKKYIVNCSGVEDGVFAEGGSLQFGGLNQFLTLTSSAQWAPGTGSFTVEWWQYQINQTAFGRVFTIGIWPTAEIAVSIETGGKFYLWLDALGNTPAVANSGSVISPYLNTWTHFAVVRESGSFLQIFQNGTPIKTITDPTNVYLKANLNNTTSSLFIGGEGDNVVNTRFSGSITNFRFVNGYALYSGSFTTAYTPFPVLGTTLLINADINQAPYVYDNSGYNNTITQNSVSWSYARP